MLQSEHLQSLPADVKQKSILVALDAAGVKVADIVEDAVRRDRALDTYERVLQKNLDELRAQKAAENAQLEAEIDQRVAELRARIDENNQAEIDREQNEPRAPGGRASARKRTASPRRSATSCRRTRSPRQPRRSTTREAPMFD